MEGVGVLFLRKDLVGSVYVAGKPLFAGDEVPEGAVVDPWLCEDVPAPEPVVEVPSANAPKRKWQGFLTSQGVDFPKSATRDELHDLWEDLDAR